ncbi:MAG: amidohydrolase family protein [Pseudomonadota bacterium]
MDLFHEDQALWLAQVQEPIVDPDRLIIDPHHHLWPDMRGDVYNIEDFTVDTSSGHKVAGTVFMECGTCYLETGPEEEKSLGETAYVLEQTEKARELANGAPILGMVGHVDLRLHDRVDDLLDRHIAIAGSFFKGIRHAGASARAADVDDMFIPASAPADLYQQTDFRRSVRRLGERGLSYDTWHFHFQTQNFIELARSCPDTQLVLDHFGTPLGVGAYQDQSKEIYEQWAIDIKELSECPNVVLKLGGLAMPDNGFAWHTAERPPNSDEFVAAQGDYYHHAIDCFSPERCMFESNFPVDRLSLGYAVLFNGFKKIAASYSDSEQEALFSGTASRIYRL